MKRQIALLLALAMLLLLAVAGCSNETENAVTEAALEAENTAEALDETSEETEPTAEAELTADSLLAAMQENMENASSMTMDMSFTMDMTIDGERVVTAMDYAYQVTSDPEAAYVSAIVTYEADFEEESMATTTETYVVLEDGVYVTYSGVDGDWYKMEIELDADLMESYTMLDMTTGCTLAGETQKVNDTECFVLTCQIQGDDLQTLMDEMGLSNLTGDMDYSALTVEETIWLDQETLLPVQATIDFGDSLTAMMEASIGLTGEDGVEFSMEPCVITASYTGFNNVDEITVPEEVVESAVSFDELLADYGDDYELVLNEDGTYLLEDWAYGYDEEQDTWAEQTVSVNIAVPAGHVIDGVNSDSTWLCFDAETDSDDEAAYVYYSLFAGYTAEDMETTFGDMFDDYSEDYDNVTVSGVQATEIGGIDVTYLTVSYSYLEDNNRQFFAWFALTEDVCILIGGDDHASGQEAQAYADVPALLATMLEAVDSDSYAVTYETETLELTQSQDGIYILEDGYSDVTVSIATPAGHVIDADSSDSTWLCFDLDEDSAYAWAYYSLYTDYTAEDMEYLYGDSFEIYEEFYADVEISGLETVTVGGWNVTYLYVVYTYDDGDRCLDFRAWAEMAEDVQVMIGGYEYDYDVDFSALLETLVDAIQ
ncbi:MAG: hypothetical protein LUC89_02450 [Oscillospiraceae bacterium]|nr:hypothetical protein [Oscillospiraceae bacterium]